MWKLQSKTSTQERDLPSREPSIREASDVVAESGTHDQTGGLEHFGHAWSSLRSEVPKNDDSLLALLESATFDGLDEFLFDIEDASLSSKLETLLAGDLGNRSPRGEVTSQDSDSWSTNAGDKVSRAQAERSD